MQPKKNQFKTILNPVLQPKKEVRLGLSHSKNVEEYHKGIIKVCIQKLEKELPCKCLKKQT
jgi:hypothetical protein